MGITLTMQGGAAFGFSAWLNGAFIGSWVGDPAQSVWTTSFNFTSALTTGANYVLTVLQDHMGYEEDWASASDFFKLPRGILDYSFINAAGASVDVDAVWKLTGNFGGEDVSFQ
jgi:hypothetical protein